MTFYKVVSVGTVNFAQDFNLTEKTILQRSYGTKMKMWILSNERRTEFLNKFIGCGRAGTGSVHFGFSGMINLDIIALRHSSYAIVGDVNENVLKYFEIIGQLIEDQSLKGITLIEARKKFVELFIKGLNKEGFFSLDRESSVEIRIKELRELLTDGISWLSSDESFSYVQSMFKNKRIIFLPLDVRDEVKFKIIVDWLKHNDLHVDTFYTSNIYRFLNDPPNNLFTLFGGLRLARGESTDRYRNNLQSVVNPQTFLVWVNPLAIGSANELSISICGDIMSNSNPPTIKEGTYKINRHNLAA